MGSKDVRHRESKKQKRDQKKPMPTVSLTSPTAEPVVVRKKRPPSE